MKFIMINDEHELYDIMMQDIFTQTRFDVEEIPRMTLSSIMRKLYNIHYDDRINRRINLPFKWIWYPFYSLHKYDFKENEEYCILFMNGSLRTHFEEEYLRKIKKKNPNVKYCVLMFDSSKYSGAKRAYELLDLFDYKFSFDLEDCEKYGLEHFYSCLSFPKFVEKNNEFYSKAYFIGSGLGRLEQLLSLCSYMSKHLNSCFFDIVGVEKNKQISINGVVYNKTISFKEDLLRAYNTDCIVEVLKNGQTGITLRTCEAVLFNKKLLTNNMSLKNLPFYDERYMHVFENAEDIDLDFITKEIPIQYEDSNYFSPVKILEKIDKMSKGEKESHE